ncbi:MAG: 50S ribosomal protein L21 [Spirochaetales bacterium]|nr:MAG: 50S ribosomal protein L21 [Spirochaetales bacterium]
MYAIVEMGGMQWKVQEKQTLRVPLMETEPGKPVQFDKVLLVADDQNIKIGRPVLDGAKVDATVVSHGKADKILVFKKKRRKNYKKLRGHRQPYSEIRIEKITA